MRSYPYSFVAPLSDYSARSRPESKEQLQRSDAYWLINLKSNSKFRNNKILQKRMHHMDNLTLVSGWDGR